MKRQIRVQMLKRFFCLTIALVCLASNVTLAYAALVYDSTTHTIDNLLEMSDNGPLIMARLGGDEYEITGNAVGDDGTVLLDNSNESSFKVINYDGGRYRMLLGIDSNNWDNGTFYGFSRDFRLDDGKLYRVNVIKEEINLENIMLTNDYKATGQFKFIGEYTLQPIDGPGTNDKLTVSMQGNVNNYTYMSSDEESYVYLAFDYNSDNNQAIFDVNGERQIKKVVSSDNVDYEKGDIGSVTIDFGIKILNAEYNTQGGAVTPLKVTAVAAASVALATTGSVALSGVSGSSSDILDLDETENEEVSGEDDDYEDEDEKDLDEQNNDTNYSFIVNNNDSLPPLCNTKGATVSIPLCIENGEDFNWSYNVIPFPVRPDIFVPGIINTGGNSAELSVLIVGKTLEENCISIYCYVSASAEGEHKAQETIEFTLYKAGLYAKVKDKSKGFTKDNLTVTYVRDSKIKGIAEIIELKNNEYDIEIIEEIDSLSQIMIIAANKEFGSCNLAGN